MRRTTAAPALLCLALLAGSTGCGGQSSGGQSTGKADQKTAPSTAHAPKSGKASPRSSSIPKASAEPFSANLRPDDGGYGSGNGLGLTGVRVGHHPGFDRVVFDLGGTGRPGWHVQYVARPRSDGSGEPVKLGGDVFLQVVLRGMGLPPDTGVREFGNSRTRISGKGTQGVAEIAPGAVFEGDQQAFIGLTGAKRPFRVFALDHPARVVVDIRDH